KPFLKWAGGKYTQLADLFVHIPAGKRLIEPFVGGGSVFLNSEMDDSWRELLSGADSFNDSSSHFSRSFDGLSTFLHQNESLLA
ncbi:DNA adenine methylase, partial [Klebsiella pneumoniae]|uniref:DNA adenine methylase n=1 Tax=Klebsiella pneumoniae TaxID=573 RepID=UPI0022EA4168